MNPTLKQEEEIFDRARQIADAGARAAFLEHAKAIGAIELELAATAAFLFAEEGIGKDGQRNPWHETRDRKPQKAAEGRLERAAAAYADLRKLETPRPLPELPPP